MGRADFEGGAERYIGAMRGALKQSLREPQTLIGGSALFWLCALPVLSLGNAWIAAYVYMKAKLEGREMTARRALRTAFREKGRAAFLMGLTDLLAVFLAGGCAVTLMSSAPNPLKFMYCVWLYIDGLYLLSGRYRYAALAAGDERPYRRAALFTLHNMGWTLLYGCVDLCLLLLCAATGIGVLLLLPAGMALFGVCAYRATLSRYQDPEEDADTADGRL